MLSIIDTAVAVSGSDSHSKLLRELAVLLLCPPAPFVNSLTNPVSFSARLLSDSSPSVAVIRQRQILVSVLASSISEIASAVIEKGILIDELTSSVPQVPSPADFEALEHALWFWGSASHDEKVKAKLQEERVPFKLYKLLRSTAGGESSLADNSEGMLATLPVNVVTGIVDLVRSLVVGQHEMEAELADLLIEDLERLSKQRDMDFVNKVFLPLIKVEKAVPLTLTSARCSSEPHQSTLLPGLSSLVETSEAQSPGPQSFLETGLLQQKQKEYLRTAFKQIVGQASSKAQAEKLLNYQWVKVHEWNANSKSAEDGELGLWRQLEGKGPCVAFSSGQGPTGQPTLFGAFWQGKVPKITEDTNPPDIEFMEGDFCFCYQTETNQYDHFVPTDDLPIAQIAVDYGESSPLAQLVIGSGFMLIAPKGCAERGCFGYLEEVRPVPVLGVVSDSLSPQVPEDLVVAATEVWVLEPSSLTDSTPKAQETDPEQTRLTSLSSDCSHPWVSPASPFNMFRAGPVYSVPAHLTVKAAVAILLKREGDAGISVAFTSSHLNLSNLPEMTVGALYSQFLADETAALEHNKILDLTYDRQKAIRDTTEIEGLKKTEM